MALIGLGVMGRRHARALRALEHRFAIVGAYDPRPDAPTPVGIDRLFTESEAIEKASVIIIATPIETHASLVGRALGAGRHVLVEKPICATANEANALAGTLAGDCRLFVGHSERFNPVVRALARLVEPSDIRELDLRRIGSSRPGFGRALMNLGVHDLDLACYLGGDVTVRAATGSGHTEVEDFAHVLFSTHGGGAGHLYVNGRSAIRERALVLTTGRWVYYGDLLTHRLFRSAQGSSAKTEVPLRLEEPLLAQAASLADALDGRAVLALATGADGARAVSLAESAGALFMPEDPIRSSRFQGILR